MVPDDAKAEMKIDFDDAREWYKHHVTELRDLDRILFRLKLGFAGLLGIVFSILFSDSENIRSFSRVFSIDMLIITFLTILLLVDEMWSSAKEHVENVMKKIRSVILHNIRHTVAVKEKENPSLVHYGAEAEELLDKGNKLFQEMRLGTAIEEIIKKLEPKIPWKRGGLYSEQRV